MILIYLLGCLASFLLLLLSGSFNRKEITLQDVIVAPLYIFSSWVFFISMIFFQFFLWLDSVTEELDDIIIWRKK